VCTVALNQKARGGTGDPERTLEVCGRVVDDRDDMVVKALSWALRELAKREPGQVEAFMARHGDALAPRVRREVRNKLETGLKNR
jgi:3-methyladenine DNA glycosylase AlkD